MADQGAGLTTLPPAPTSAPPSSLSRFSSLDSSPFPSPSLAHSSPPLASAPVGGDPASCAGTTLGLWAADPEGVDTLVGADAPEVMDESERVDSGGETMRSCGEMNEILWALGLTAGLEDEALANVEGEPDARGGEEWLDVGAEIGTNVACFEGRSRGKTGGERDVSSASVESGVAFTARLEEGRGDVGGQGRHSHLLLAKST